MKRGKGSSFGDWITASVQRKGNKARIQTKPNGSYIVLNKFPKNLPNGLLSIQFNREKREVNAFKPINGVYKFKTKDFARKEGKPPIPTFKTDQWGNEYHQFIAVLEIQDDEKFDGCIVPYILRYKFEPIIIEKDGKEVQALGTSGYGKHTERLEQYLQVAGVWDITFPYKDNALPMILKAVLQKEKTFQGSIEKGWITSLYSSSVPDEDTDFDGFIIDEGNGLGVVVKDETPWKE